MQQLMNETDVLKHSMETLLWLQIVLTLALVLVIIAAISVMFLSISKGEQIMQRLIQLSTITNRMEQHDLKVESALDGARQRADEVIKGENGGAAADAAAKTY